MKKVVYIVEDKKCAQYRYRVQNVQEALKKSRKWEAGIFLKTEEAKIKKALQGAELMVIERQTAKNNQILRIIAMAHKMGVEVLFDLDDLVFDFRDLPVLMRATNSRNVFYWMGYVGGIRRIARRVDGFLTTNDFLGEKLERSYGKPYQVIPNSLNQKQVDVSKKYVKEKQHTGFVIGYFSGSPTHVRDFRLVEAELVDFLQRHRDAKLLVVGYMEFSKMMEEMIRKKKVKVRKLVDYLELQRLMTEVDINIAPLVVDDFTNCKSELKFFEAAIVETVTMASPNYTYEQAIEDGETGLLVQPKKWSEKLEYLYEYPAERRKMAKAACKYALDNYYGKKFLLRIEGAYDYFVG